MKAMMMELRDTHLRSPPGRFLSFLASIIECVAQLNWLRNMLRLSHVSDSEEKYALIIQGFRRIPFKIRVLLLSGMFRKEKNEENCPGSKRLVARSLLLFSYTYQVLFCPQTPILV